MTTRFESVQRIAISFVGALVFATIAITTAAPIVPIA